MKNTYVIFREDLEIPRILVNPDEETLAMWAIEGSTVLVNPKRVNLDGVPLENWQYDEKRNEIYPKQKHLKTPDARVEKPDSEIPWKQAAVGIAAGALGAGTLAAIQYFLK